jgi:hypothetical protein
MLTLGSKRLQIKRQFPASANVQSNMLALVRSLCIDDHIRLLREEFRKRFPTVSNCTNLLENVARVWEYTDKSIRIVKVYSSENHWLLAQLRLETYRCDGPPDDAFIDQWFVISPGNSVKFLDQGMTLVDAGDYDADGKSELVFSIDQDNRGGYQLFYRDFEKHSTFVFSYH